MECSTEKINRERTECCSGQKPGAGSVLDGVCFLPQILSLSPLVRGAKFFRGEYL